MEPEEWISWLRTWPADPGWRDRVDDPTAAEALLVEQLQQVAMPTPPGASPGTLTVDALRLDGHFPDTRLIVEFRAERRYPRSRFAWPWPLWTEETAWDDYVFWVNLVELVEAADIHLPAQPGQLAWVE